MLTNISRSQDVRRLSWQEKRFYHLQFEVLLNYMHSFVGHMIPVLVLGVSTLATASTVMLLRIDLHEGGPGCAPCASLVLIGFAAAAWLGGFFIINFLERFEEGSGAILRSIADDITIEAHDGSGCWYGGRLVRRSFAARLFRRRLLRIRVGTFRTMEAGFAVEFFQMTSENMVTYALMVNLKGQMWLL